MYCQGDIIQGVQADAGQHITAGTSQGSGHVKILEGHDSVKVGPDKIPIARHDSKCLVNCDASGNGGAAGKLVTEQKTVGGAPATAASNPDAPPGERTSPQLERLQDAKAKIESGQLDFNALDEYINFKDANQGLDGLIGQIQGTPGGATDYLAQGTRGLLGFGKDIVTGVGELAYEGIKGVPKLGRMALTSDGRALAQIDGQILAENMRLGNITPGTVGQGALDMGAAIVKPITDPWKRGDYVEAVTRGAAELLSAPIAWTKAQKAAQAAKAKAALDAAEAAKAKAALDAAEAARAKAALEAEEAAGDAAKAGDGVHVSATPVKPKGGAWDYAPNWEKWEKDGGRVVPNPDGSVNYIRKDGVEVLYNKEGFPDFSPHAKHSVEINAMKGDHYWDFKAANEKIGLTGSKPPEGFTWHHVQDGKTMQLIPQSIHNAPMGGFSHAGGVYSLGP